MRKRRRIRVLHILEATIGGTREHVLQVLRGVDRSRFEVSLLCSVERDPGFMDEVERLRAEGIAVFVVPMKRAISLWRDMVAFCRILAHLLARRYDVVHTHSSKAGFLGRTAAWLAGVRRIIHTGHIFYFQWRLGTPAGKFYRLLEWIVARMSDRLIALSEEQRALLVRCGVARPRQVVVVPNGVALARWSDLPARGAARATLGLPPSGPVVGMAARLERQKGCRHFLRAAQQVLRRRPDAVFVLVGDGSYAGQLAELADKLELGDRFHLVGHWEDMRSFYAALDLFALSSLWEGMPYVILEAMACGVAVCATDIPGTRETIVAGESGVLTPPEDDAALVEEITRLLNDPEALRRMGARGRQIVRTRYARRTFLRKIEEVYEDVLSHTS